MDSTLAPSSNLMQDSRSFWNLFYFKIFYRTASNNISSIDPFLQDRAHSYLQIKAWEESISTEAGVGTAVVHHRRSWCTSTAKSSTRKADKGVGNPSRFGRASSPCTLWPEVDVSHKLLGTSCSTGSVGAGVVDVTFFLLLLGPSSYNNNNNSSDIASRIS